MTEHVELRLSAYHDGSLDPAESERVRAHLETCSSCLSTSEEHRRLEALLTEATETAQPSTSLWPGVAARLEPRPALRLTFRFAGGLAFAAAAGIALSLAVPTRTPIAEVEADLWDALGYGLVNNAPATLAALDTEVDE